MQRYNSSVHRQSVLYPQEGQEEGHCPEEKQPEGYPHHLVNQLNLEANHEKIRELDNAPRRSQRKKRKRGHISYKNRQGITDIDQLYEVVQNYVQKKVINLRRYHTDMMDAVMFIGEKFFFPTLRHNGNRVSPLADFIPSWMKLFASGAVQVGRIGDNDDQRREGEVVIGEHEYYDRLQEEIRTALYDMLDEIGKDGLKCEEFDAKYRAELLKKIDEVHVAEEKDPEEEDDVIMCQLGRILKRDGEGGNDDPSLAKLLGSMRQFGGCKRTGRRRHVVEQERKGHRRFCSVRLDEFAKMWLS